MFTIIWFTKHGRHQFHSKQKRKQVATALAFDTVLFTSVVPLLSIMLFSFWFETYGLTAKWAHHLSLIPGPVFVALALALHINSKGKT